MVLNVRNLAKSAERSEKSLLSVVKDRTLKNYINRVDGLLCPKNDKNCIFLSKPDTDST